MQYSLPSGLNVDGRRRVLVSSVRPEIDAGRSPIKRILGDRLIVEADLLVDGHSVLGGVVRHRARSGDPFSETPLTFVENDRWQAAIELDTLGRWQYTVEAWVDEFATWRWGFGRKVEAGQDVSVELRGGLQLIAEARARGESDLLATAQLALSRPDLPIERRAALALDPKLAAEMARRPDRRLATPYARTLEVVVDPPLARFSAWYEMFPRSCGAPGQHGTFADAAARLPYIAELGFDVLYLPPIHPIGITHRKGRNNSLVCEPGDPGSPWAIGGPAGGHKAIHPQLGSDEDFRRFVEQARGLGIAVALDIAFQASPDHPWVREHTDWFVHRPDGTIQYAENPPKKYQDVYPLDFDGEDWKRLWEELRSVFLHWIDRGVRVFRVDNPHTKPLPFWQWCIDSIKAQHPEVIFLAEAFTRPKLMYALAKAGFTQSYTYFTWRNTKAELTSYLTELTRGEPAEYLRPNFWPTTPDILPEPLQVGGRAASLQRLILAATLSSNYGIYGPSFELTDVTARSGAEEHADSEKYQLRAWDLERADSLRHVIVRLNRIRRENPSLQDNRTLRFHSTDNDRVLCYSKFNPDGGDVLVMAVNLDPRHKHSAWLDLDLSELGLRPEQTFQVHDLLGDGRFLWRGGRNFVELDPAVMPAQIFRVRRLVRSEQQFEYYL